MKNKSKAIKTIINAKGDKLLDALVNALTVGTLFISDCNAKELFEVIVSKIKDTTTILFITQYHPQLFALFAQSDCWKLISDIYFDSIFKHRN